MLGKGPRPNDVTGKLGSEPWGRAGTAKLGREAVFLVHAFIIICFDPEVSSAPVLGTPGPPYFVFVAFAHIMLL